MIRQVLLIFACVLVLQAANAQTDSSHLRVSLLTCGTGDEIWETFGHTAIRVIDSVEGKDIVYNYGTFNFDKDFELKFMRGKLLYYVSYYAYESFLAEYADAKRSVEEQNLLLDGEKKQEIYKFLKRNALEENRYYKYDFFFDNCATRLRDVFPRSLGSGFKFGKTAAADHKITYRNIMNQYFYRVHWERFGVNLLLGSKIDRQMTNEEIMFLPDFLRDGIAGATVNGQPVADKTVPVLPGLEKKTAGLNEPLILNIILCILTIVGLSVPSLKKVGNIMQFIMLLVSGLFGCLMLFMWWGTDHQGCQNNYNLLWALPTNLIMAFRPNKSRYAIIAIVLLLVALVLHVLHIQELPILELSPLLISLLFIYGSIYKKNA